MHSGLVDNNHLLLIEKHLKISRLNLIQASILTLSLGISLYLCFRKIYEVRGLEARLKLSLRRSQMKKLR